MPDGPTPLPPDRLGDLVSLTNRVFRSGKGDMGREYPLVFDPDRPEGMRVVLEGDRVVSHVGVCVRDASLLGVPLRIASIGAVCTDRDCRGKGYAGSLMEDAVAYARGRGCQLMLISGDRSLYRRLGGVRPGGFTRIEVAAGDLPAGYALDRAGLTDVPDLARLYQREPVRFVRPHEDWRKLLTAGMLMNAPADAWLVRDAEEALAYVAVQRPGGDNLPTVQEYAGSREAVGSALGALAGAYGASSVRVSLMPGDVDMLGRARRAGSVMHAANFTGTVKALDVAELVGRVRPLWEERAGAETLDALRLRADRDGLTYVHEGREVRLEGPDVTLAVFGAERGSEGGSPRIPGIEPLPLFWYGYNYV